MLDDNLISIYEIDTGFTFSTDYCKFIKELGNIMYGSIVFI
ncbi:hypothetical protein OZX61_12590 (plasmid) [Acinetobacter sp. ESL0695]|nr:hypothetical protein [Acinetobacter sp. ESL0695]WEV50208.1 hypothetical protein OZX61_12590 [Acinetobacter sp. ESL0695]